MTAAPELLMLDEKAVHRLFTVETAVESQRRAFTARASGEAVLPPRLLVPGSEDSVAFCYAARLTPRSAAVSKFGSVNPRNAAGALPSVHALVTVLDADTGVPAAVMDGTAVTTLRTAAASALAMDVLAAPRVRSLAVFGTGVQAEAHLRACLSVREVEHVLVVGRVHEGAREFVHAQAARYPQVDMRAVDAAEAVDRADVLALCTTSSSPVLDTNRLRPGATVLAVGSFAPDRHEFDSDVLRRARLVVDDPGSAATDCGPVVAALAAGVLRTEELIGLGEVLLGTSAGRRSATEIVVFASVGVGVQDAAAAEAILTAARAERESGWVR